MLPAMPGQKAQKNAMFASPEMNPFGVETQGGGPQPMQPMPFSGTDAPMVKPLAMASGKPSGDPQNDMSFMGARGLGPMPQPEAQPAQGLQPPQMGQQPAKPMGNGPMPDPNMAPRIRAPQNPGYQAQTPTLPGLPQPGQNNVTAPNVQAQGAQAGQFDVNAFRPFADSVYSEATRQLDPMFQQREEDFRQRMVNQGIGEGSDAYNKAFANFSRERNDAYGSARNQALSQALGAQNQFFGQSATNAQMANQMGQFNAGNSLQAQGMNLQDRNSLLGLGLQAQGMGMQDRQFGAGMGLNYDQMRQQAQMQNASNFINQNQFGRNLGFQGERADMQDLMQLLGYGQGVTSYNNSLMGMDQQRAGALFGLIPGLTPTQLDVNGTANQFMNMQNANMQARASQQNGMMGALGQIGSTAVPFMMASDVRVKTDIQKVGKLDNGLPIYLYRYKSGGPFHIGVMAQEVEQTKPHAVHESEGIKFVNYAEAVK